MKRYALIILLLFLLPFAACRTSTPESRAQNAADTETVVFTDDLGRELCISRPERVAALIGSYADVWCLAGGRDTLAAAADDTWTSFDLALDADVVDLGAVKQPNVELLLAAEPDLILASCNTQADLELMDIFDKAGIPAAYFDVQSFEDYDNMLKICCELTGQKDNYDLYAVQVRAQIEEAALRQDGSHPTVLCIRATGSGCKAKGSRDNLLGGMLADLGCVNIADSSDTLLEDLSLEAIAKADPDYIFVVLQGSDPSDAQAVLTQTLLTNKAWQQLTAVREDRLFYLEHELYNLKPNARWGAAYEKLADILYQN